MRKLWLLFLAVGVLGAGMALARPRPRSLDTERGMIAAIMRSHGFRATGVRQNGNALFVMSFASGACRNIRIVPIGFMFQEMPLLKRVGLPGDNHSFVYLDRGWPDFAPAAMISTHLRQTLLQMTRLAPRNSTGTMLYILAPKGCEGAGAIDWSPLWRPTTL